MKKKIKDKKATTTSAKSKELFKKTAKKVNKENRKPTNQAKKTKTIPPAKKQKKPTSLPVKNVIIAKKKWKPVTAAVRKLVQQITHGILPGILNPLKPTRRNIVINHLNHLQTIMDNQLKLTLVPGMSVSNITDYEKLTSTNKNLNEALMEHVVQQARLEMELKREKTAHEKDLKELEHYAWTLKRTEDKMASAVSDKLHPLLSEEHVQNYMKIDSDQFKLELPAVNRPAEAFYMDDEMKTIRNTILSRIRSIGPIVHEINKTNSKLIALQMDLTKVL